MLMLRQSYLARKLQHGELNKLGEMKSVQKLIQNWYQKEGEKLILQTKTDEVNINESVRLHHHSLHKKNLKKSSILRLQTENGIIEGHEKCCEYLEKQVEDLLLRRHPVDPAARNVLLQEVMPVFTDADNDSFLALPSLEEVKTVVTSSNQKAAP